MRTSADLDAGLKLFTNSPESESVGGLMSELIDRVVSDVGIDRGVAEKAIGIILDFLSKEGPADRVQSLLGAAAGSSGVDSGGGE